MKGIGIVAVVAGHVWEPAHDYLFWFHMPLFYCISGYLYSHPASSRHYLAGKVRHLLIPYFCFLILLSLPEYVAWTVDWIAQPSWPALESILWLTAGKLHGGVTLTGWFSIFWFVTCLFFTQQVYHWLYRWLGHNRLAMLAVAVGAYLLALANARLVPGLMMPWSLNVVPMAFVFYYLGHQARLLRFTPGWQVLPALLLILAAVLLKEHGILDLDLEMKTARYGIPFFSTALAVSCIVVVQGMSRILSTWKPLQGLLAAPGQASMVIMYLHWGVQALLFQHFGVTHPLARIVLTLAVCLALFRLLAFRVWTRRLFLGVAAGATYQARAAEQSPALSPRP